MRHHWCPIAVAAACRDCSLFKFNTACPDLHMKQMMHQLAYVLYTCQLDLQIALRKCTNQNRSFAAESVDDLNIFIIFRSERNHAGNATKFDQFDSLKTSVGQFCLHFYYEQILFLAMPAPAAAIKLHPISTIVCVCVDRGTHHHSRHF